MTVSVPHPPLRSNRLLQSESYEVDCHSRLRKGKVDTWTKLADGTTIEGLDGLRNYLKTERRDDVVRQFCRKLLDFV